MSVRQRPDGKNFARGAISRRRSFIFHVSDGYGNLSGMSDRPTIADAIVRAGARVLPVVEDLLPRGLRDHLSEAVWHHMDYLDEDSLWIYFDYCLSE